MCVFIQFAAVAFIVTIQAAEIILLYYRHRCAFSSWQSHFSLRHFLLTNSFSPNWIYLPLLCTYRNTIRSPLEWKRRKRAFVTREILVIFNGSFLMITSVCKLSEFIMWHWQMHYFPRPLVWFSVVCVCVSLAAACSSQQCYKTHLRKKIIWK